MSPPTSRPLAPALSPVSSLAGNAQETAQSPALPQPTSIKRASTACQSCKQIKRKCDQAQPCSNCRKSNTDCVYNEADDGRRRAARKRTVESLELKRDALDSILESLRTSDDGHVQTLVNLIRSDTPLEEIIQYATDHAATLPAKQLRSLQTVVHGRPRKNVLTVIDLCDTPLVRVPSKPWTNVTNDDELVSHLVSVYFTWFHVAYPIVTKDRFLSDMNAGITNCRHCSPLLVNAILAIACHFTDHPRACQVPNDASTRGRHFMEEAVQLWNEQGGRPSELNVQAGAVLAVVSTLVGRDRISWSYVENINVMQQELWIKTQQARRKGLTTSIPEERKSLSFTAQTVFNLTVGYGIAFMKDSVPVEPISDSSTDPILADQTARWFPYPQQSPEMTLAFHDLQRAYHSLHRIGYDIQHMLFGGEKASREDDIASLDDHLRYWHQTLPESLDIGDDTSLIAPPVMDLHLTYYWLRTSLFNFVKTNHVEPSTEYDRPNITRQSARSHVLESAQAIANLCQRYARDFGLKQTTVWMPQTTATAAYSLLDILSDPNQASMIQDTFHELCLVIVAASRRWLIMKGHVRMLYMTAEERGHQLPAKTKQLLKMVALDKWGETDHLHFASASYPNYALAKEDDPRLAAMGDLLERWATLQVAESDDTVGDIAPLSSASSKSPEAV